LPTSALARTRAAISLRADVARDLFSISDASARPARGPPGWEEDVPESMPDWDLFGQPEADAVFDQRIAR
jgi:hypothetical protein